MANGSFFLAMALAILSSISFANNELFKCLENRDYACIALEIDIDDDWSRSINSNKNTPLEFAILAKDRHLIRYLLKRGARVNTEQIILMMETFYDSEFRRRSIPKEQVFGLPENISLVQKLLLAASEDDDPKDKFIKLSKILDLFTSRERLAENIFLFAKLESVEQRYINILLRKYKNLFLQDYANDRKAVISIIKHLLPLKVEKWLMRFILDSLDSETKNNIVTHELTDDSNDFSFIPEQISHAIMEQSRSYFTRLPPAMFVRHIYMKEPIEAFSKSVFFSEKLSSFIISIIIYPDKKKLINRNYTTWLEVYNLLVEHGDFFSAFSVGSALSSYSVEKAVSPRIYQKITLLDPASSFKNYRMAVADFAGKFHIPSTQVISKDLTTTSELSLTETAQSRILLNMKGIEYFTNLRNNLSSAHKLAYTRDFPSTQNIVNLIKIKLLKNSACTLMDLDRACRILWPKRLDRSLSVKLNINNINAINTISNINNVKKARFINNNHTALMIDLKNVIKQNYTESDKNNN